MRSANSWQKVVSTACVAALATGFVVASVVQRGYAITELDLNDSGVWVTNQSQLLAGRFNFNAGRQDGAVEAMSAAPDVVQDGSTVLLWDSGAGQLWTINPAQLTTEGPLELAAGSQIELGGGQDPNGDRVGVAAILVPELGSLWVIPQTSVASFQPDAFPATLEELAPESVISVGVDGVTHVFDPGSGRLISLAGQGSAVGTVIAERHLTGTTPGGSFAITAVGSVPVLWDVTARRLFLDGGRSVDVQVSAEDEEEGLSLALQQPGPESDQVLVETPDALIAQPLDGSEPVSITPQATGGKPSRPVKLGGCSYAVWSATTAFVRDCPGESADESTLVPDADVQDDMRLRVNRGHVVLNQISTGKIWIITEDLKRVDKWDEVAPSEEKDLKEKDDKDETEEEATPERSETNHPPVAVDDGFGVRPGRSVLLPVVENDQDSDGDLLTVRALTTSLAIGELSTVYSDSVFQIDVPQGATGAATFQYEVSDGRGGKDTATVQLTVRPENTNEPPQQVRTSTKIPVVTGKRVSYNVLTDWRDPDGDDIFLKSAEVANPEDVVEVKPDGAVTFIDGGKVVGPKSVTIIVSDGRSETTGELLLDVRPSGARPPEVRADLVSGTVGTEIAVAPLLNDIDPNGRALRLVKVDEKPGADIRLNPDSETFTISSDQVGTSYLTYTVTNGPKAAQGLIRVDVKEAPAQDAPPVAVPDTVRLPKGGQVVAAVLNNDVNPLGYPLVLIRAEAGEKSPVQLEILNHETIKITELREFDEPIAINYWISNGRLTARSTLTVVPVAPPAQVRPPQAVNDEVRVRVGDVATVSVLRNDTHPDGIPLHLVPELSQVPDPDSEALVFTSGDQIRVHARQVAGTYSVPYQVEATQGGAEPDTGMLRIHVLTADPEHNQAPRPQEVAARTLSGLPVTVKVPLDGIDPDGDYVTLVGVDQAPEVGRIQQVLADGFVYEPGRTVGSAEFTYVVQDRLGAQATAKVTIGIADTTDGNLPPVAVTDQVETQPGRMMRVPVVQNDTDPDGDEIFLVADSATSPDFEASTKADRVVFAAPDQPGEYSAQYTIKDGYGQESVGVVLVTVDEDIPPKKPRPRDDLVALEQILGQDSVTVDVLANDEDSDGDVDEAELVVHDDAATVDDGKVTVAVKPELQIIDYSLTDPDGLSGEAFIMVPGTDQIVPQLKPGVSPLTVVAGTSTSVQLADYVFVRPGREPQVAEANKVTAWNGNATADSATQLSFTAPADYVGDAAISLQVTDGEGPDDPDGRKATVTIPVVITAADGSMNQPPSMRGVTMQVEAGEEATMALRPYVDDPDPDDAFGFEIVTPPELGGVTATIDGENLRVQADSAVAKGSLRKLTVSVTDGHNDPATAEVTIEVVPSRRPLAKAADDEVPDAHQGVTECVDATVNDWNPFPGEPLTVTDATVETGAGQVTTGCGSNGVSVTPDRDFHGQLVVRYTIRDATEDPDREVVGRIRLNVKGRPEAPTGLRIAEVGNRTVVLEWSPPVNNGAPVTDYTVTGSPSYTRSCGTQTICELTGLTNDVTYTFSVTATNEVGTSDPSARSAEARPDTLPNRPQAPTLTFGDRQLTVAWRNPGSDGSPVTSYDLEISPPPASGNAQRTGVTGVSFTWTGLDNGTRYRVKVCARNRAPGVCEEEFHWSDYSAEETPAGVPDAPNRPQVERLSPVGNQAQARVCWNAPYNNGDSISQYRITSSTGAQTTTSDTCQTMRLDTSTTDYSFRVQARNKAGWGSNSASSDPFRAFTPPGRVTNLRSTDADNACQLSFGAAPLNGANSSQVRYLWRSNSGRSGDFGSATSGTASGLANNQTYTLTVWAVTTVQGTSYEGPTQEVSGCRPYGTPNAPTVSAAQEGSQQVRFNWTAPARNGRDIARIQISVDNGGWQDQGAGNGSTTVGNGYSQTHSIRVRAVDTEGQTSAIRSASATSQAEPAPWVSNWRINGNTVSFDWGNITADRSIRCWNTDTWDNRNWDTNFAGEPVTNYPFRGGSGHMEVTCGDLGPVVSIEILGWDWFRIR